MGAGLVAAPDGKRIVFHSFSDAPAQNLTTIQDPLGEQPPLTLAPPDSTKSVQSLSFTPDGQSVAVLTTENRVVVFRRPLCVGAGEAVSAPLPFPQRGAEFSPQEHS